MTAFLLNWTPRGWPYAELKKLIGRFERDGEITVSWRFSPHRMGRAGDRAYFHKQGSGPRGLFAVGEFVSDPYEAPAGSGRHVVDVRIRRMTDPLLGTFISREEMRDLIPERTLRHQQSGVSITDEMARALDARLAAEAAPPEEAAGGPWSAREIDLVVDDYLAMLAKETAGKTYDKSAHRRRLRRQLARSDGSIDFQHQNISAVLHELGLPFIRGYRPRGNYQGALFEAIEQRLAAAPRLIDKLDRPRRPGPQARPLDDSAFVAPPPPRVAGSTPEARAPARPRSIDPAARDERNRSLGAAGEDYVVALERKCLEARGRPDLAAAVRHLSKEYGDGLGYDIESFDDDGSPIYIEVKTTRGGIATDFFVSPNEIAVSKTKGARYRLYRVHDFDGEARIYRLAGPLDACLDLIPDAFRARPNGGTAAS